MGCRKLDPNDQRVTCPHIKRDGSVCGRVCTRTTGCAKHWNLHEKNIAKGSCSICGVPTVSITGCCPKHSDHPMSLQSNR
ncbi:hypothetical protein Glove_486g3 [Diversispora epigaea]|uniref:Uncharacterized protein n=1 Tax=Diversispora epigaea TaxID=1348612 RepID=A0A397GN99_9GLOM|nr:hypothetical protein Glove_486g3 [Diversispora epigaea]